MSRFKPGNELFEESAQGAQDQAEAGEGEAAKEQAVADFRGVISTGDRNQQAVAGFRLAQLAHVEGVGERNRLGFTIVQNNGVRTQWGGGEIVLSGRNGQATFAYSINGVVLNCEVLRVRVDHCPLHLAAIDAERIDFETGRFRNITGRYVGR